MLSFSRPRLPRVRSSESFHLLLHHALQPSEPPVSLAGGGDHTSRRRCINIYDRDVEVAGSGCGCRHMADRDNVVFFLFFPVTLLQGLLLGSEPGSPTR